MSSRNDIQSAVKRNLHNWTSWRIDLNRRLTDAVLDGRPFDDHDSIPLQRYLATPLTLNVSTPATTPPPHRHHHDDYRRHHDDARHHNDARHHDDDYRHTAEHHPAEHPRTLLAYSAALHSETCMDQQSFLSFGIPRAKVLRYPEQGGNGGQPKTDDIINPQDYVTTPEDYEDAGEWEAGGGGDDRGRGRGHRGGHAEVRGHANRDHSQYDHYAIRHHEGQFDSNPKHRSHTSERRSHGYSNYVPR